MTPQEVAASYDRIAERWFGDALRHLEHDQPPSAHVFVIVQRRI